MRNGCKEWTQTSKVELGAAKEIPHATNQNIRRKTMSTKFSLLAGKGLNFQATRSMKVEWQTLLMLTLTLAYSLNQQQRHIEPEITTT